MARLNNHHRELKDGVGKCSCPMWMNGLPAGFCDQPAYGVQESNQRRSGEYGPGYGPGGRWFPGGVWTPKYVPALACYSHGGPLKSTVN